MSILKNTTYIITLFMMWSLFGMFNLINCDLYKLIKTNIVFTHLAGIISLFILFNVLDNHAEYNVTTLWLKTILIYILLLILLQTKYYYSVIVIFLLFISQSLDVQIKHLHSEKKNVATLTKIRKYILICIYLCIFIGFIHYIISKYHNNNLCSFLQDFIHVKC